jgi:N6-adenosine-specific RNA methylase IME4
MELVKWNNAKNAIAECKTIDEVKEIRDKAEALRLYAKQAGESLQMQNDIAEIKLRAERKAGELLKEIPKHEGKTKEYGSIGGTIPTLPEGINKKQSHTWQRIADIPEEQFENHILDTKLKNEELTTKEIYNFASQLLQKEKRSNLKQQLLPENKYQVIYADPPWAYNDKCEDGAIQSRGANKVYPTMLINEICALPINNLSYENSVLFIWVTSPLLEDGFCVINSWGFEYKASFVWDKIKHNMGHYNSVRHEFLLIATKGSCTPDNLKLFDSVLSIEKTEHSKKPYEFYEIIETLYSGKKIELFARNKREGWDCWGNEI